MEVDQTFQIFERRGHPLGKLQVTIQPEEPPNSGLEDWADRAFAEDPQELLDMSFMYQVSLGSVGPLPPRFSALKARYKGLAGAVKETAVVEGRSVWTRTPILASRALEERRGDCSWRATCSDCVCLGRCRSLPWTTVTARGLWCTIWTAWTISRREPFVLRSTASSVSE